MALAIVALNKKGYKTIFSCSGHNFHDLSEVTIMPCSACTINGAFIEVPADCEPKVFVRRNKPTYGCLSQMVPTLAKRGI